MLSLDECFIGTPFTYFKKTKSNITNYALVSTGVEPVIGTLGVFFLRTNGKYFLSVIGTFCVSFCFYIVLIICFRSFVRSI